MTVDIERKRIVVWSKGFVARMVIVETVKYPLFELVGVGVSSPEKVGRDAGTIVAPAVMAVAIVGAMRR